MKKKPLKIMSFVSLFLATSLVVVAAVAGDDGRIREELRDPDPTLNPLQKALGKERYERAMASGKYHYVGNTKCRLCHRDFFVGRKKDPHVHSYELLVATGYQNEERCLGCHTTGHQVPTGYTSFDKTPKLVGVQCEGCHGPGSEHVRLHRDDSSPFSIGVPRINRPVVKNGKKEIKGGFLAGADNPRIIKRMCLSCHTKRWGRSFPRTAHDFQSAYDLYKTPLPGDDENE